MEVTETIESLMHDEVDNNPQDTDGAAPNSRFLRSWTIRGLILVLVLAVLGLFFLASSPSPSQATTPVAVRVVESERRDVPIVSEWIGSTDGTVNAEIRSQVTGYLVKRHYAEGAFVRKGQLLFELDSRPFQAAVDQANALINERKGQLEQATAQVAQAEAQAALAGSEILQAEAQVSAAVAGQRRTQLDVDKYRPLVEQKAVTQQDFDNAIQSNEAAKAQVDAARARVSTARAQLRAAEALVRTATAAVSTASGQLQNAEAGLKTAELNLGFTRIVSPIDGIAGIAAAQVGDLVQATGSPLVTISAVDPIRVFFSLSETEYLAFTRSSLIDGQHGTTQSIQLTMVLPDGSEFPHKGTLYLADRQVDPGTGAIRLAGIFENPGNVLRPGQYARIRAVTGVRQDAVLVPQRCVQELQGKYSVAVVGESNIVEIRSISVGDRIGSDWIISEGLNAGETVVVEGLQKVRTGVEVSALPYEKQ